MAKTLEQAKAVSRMPASALPSRRRSVVRGAALAYHHNPPARFRPGEPLAIELSMEKTPASVRLFYRRVK